MVQQDRYAACTICSETWRHAIYLYTYDLVDAGDFRLEDCDGVSNRGLLVGVGDGRGAESAGLQRGELLVLAHSRNNFRKHPLIIINLLTMID